MFYAARAYIQAEPMLMSYNRNSNIVFGVTMQLLAQLKKFFFIVSKTY